MSRRQRETAAMIMKATAALSCVFASLPAYAQISTSPLSDPANAAVLGTALNPTGLTITSVQIHNGVAGTSGSQFGTYSNFNTPPVTIRDGIVLSSGDVTNLGPFAKPPGYSDPLSGSVPNVTNPPQQVNNAMDPNGLGGTPEFDAYGSTPITGSTATLIENFSHSHDVAALQVNFHLDTASQIQFDFIFGSVEYPYWTSNYTDAFLVFLDGTDVASEITHDANGKPIQVGVSFANLVVIGDQNTAFSNPHGVIHHLTTTTGELSGGEGTVGDHTLLFEVGDVNDSILDSVAFIANLRAQAGIEGTEPTDDVPEPASLTLLTLGTAALITRRTRRRH